MLVTMLAVFTVSATSASMARFVVEDDSFGSGDEIVRLKVLRNTQSGEKVEIVPALGGKTEALLLRTPRGDLREVLLDHHRNATAVHANVGWKGAMLVPYANRVANGTYTLNGVTHYLERNEVTPFPTCDPRIRGVLIPRRGTGRTAARSARMRCTATCTASRWPSSLRAAARTTPRSRSATTSTAPTQATRSCCASTSRTLKRVDTAAAHGHSCHSHGPARSPSS